MIYETSSRAARTVTVLRPVILCIDDEDLEDLRTVRDAVDYVYAKLEAG